MYNMANGKGGRCRRYGILHAVHYNWLCKRTVCSPVRANGSGVGEVDGPLFSCLHFAPSSSSGNILPTLLLEDLSRTSGTNETLVRPPADI